MRRSFIKKLKENRIIVIIICVIIVSIIYLGAQKAIDNFIFDSNNDIVTEDELVVKSEENAGDKSLEGQISDEEINLILSEDEDDTEDIEECDIDENVVNENTEELGKKADGENNQSIETSKIYVYITGEVNNPGVVILNQGSRIVDAINSAGGTTVNANISKVNLVYVLDDGMKVNIPNNNDLKNNPDFEYITMNSGDGGNDDYLTSSSRDNSSSESSKSYTIVNINTATQTELETLPGIGPSLALKIINYRKENGKFSSIEEIKNVSGIGDSKFENLKGYITV